MKKIIFFTLLFLSNTVFAKELKSENDIRKFSDMFMAYITKEQVSKAFDTAKPNWPIPKVEIDGLANTVQQQWPIISNRFGKSIEYEFVRKERIGKSFLRYYYLHKFSNHAIYWKIDFYKPNNAWIINTITFQDNLDILYE
ncbi:MAG: hypothetical protein R3182_09845 [Draconibacterium sp.]|nr:hypothetical protein [Draconibacterium sp.]